MIIQKKIIINCN